MKNNVIETLKNAELSPVQQFNSLLGAFASGNGNPNVLRNHNNRGFTTQGLETLVYDVKKLYEISDIDIAEYQVPEVAVTDENLRNADQLQIIAKGAEDQFANVLRDMDETAKSGLRFRSNYPFLSEDDTPIEIKGLATDAITSFEKYRTAHSKLFDEVANVAEPKLSDEEIYSIANGLLGDFETNREVHAELEHYGKTKEILGEHKIFADLKLQRTIEAMTPEELSKRSGNLKTYISKRNGIIKNKKKTAEEIDKAKAEKKDFEKEKSLVDARLAEKK